MSKHAIVVILLVLATISVGPASALGPKNLLSNPGFEAGVRGWAVEGDAVCEIDTLARQGGRQSVRVSARPGAKSDLLKVYGTVPARPGETYRARFWVLAGPMTDGSEPYGALEFMNGVRRIGLVHTDFGVNRYEPNVWHMLGAVGIVPEGATSVRLSMIMHPHGTVRFDDAELVRLHDAPKPESPSVRLTLKPNEIISRDWRGFGCQGEILLYLDRSIRQGVNDDDRRLIKQRIRAMRPKYIRLTVRLSDWEPELGMRTPNSDAMRDMKATIALYKEVGADVQLTEWGHALPDWCRPNGRLPHQDMRRAFTDSWASLLKYLRNDCRLTNVRYVTMHNEPNGMPWEDYRTICRSLDASLKAAGIRRDVQVIGPDEACENLLLPMAVRDLDDVLDCYDAHGYTANTGPEFGLWLESKIDLMRGLAGSKHVSARKPFLVTEFGMADGMDTWRTPHNDEYRYGLFLADSAIVSCNLGVSGMAMYCISDYDCGTKMQWGLWKSKDENWEPRPGFYAWSLITRYTELGSTVHPLSGDASSIPAVAFRAPKDGIWTLMAVNRGRSTRPLAISALPPNSRWSPFIYSEESIPTPDRGMLLPRPTQTADSRGTLRASLPPNAFVLWHEAN